MVNADELARLERKYRALYRDYSAAPEGAARDALSARLRELGQQILEVKYPKKGERND